MKKDYLPVLEPEVLKTICRGIEKESLRVTANGTLSEKKHPVGLGSALTHPKITTDFSESQLELITKTHTSVENCIHELKEIHQNVYRHLGDEFLWCNSMPCNLPNEECIPIGTYGSSNVGTAKTVYRNGLHHRYGSTMQMISGIHYNFSLPSSLWEYYKKTTQNTHSIETISNQYYFALIRNFQRQSWLLLYLFGASPAVCADFAKNTTGELKQLRSGDKYLPFATSLRMGPKGYQSNVQSSISVSYNSLDSYTKSLKKALTDPYPPYASIGIKDGDNYNQLATSLLQIENEFYSTIRPKRRIKPGERALNALNSRGVEYIEIRAIDLDPFCNVGITAETIRFVDIFLIHCLLNESAYDSTKEIVKMNHNQHVVAEYGRDPNIKLANGNNIDSLRDWGLKILDECLPIAEALDSSFDTEQYVHAMKNAENAVKNPQNTLSSRVLEEIENLHDGSFHQFTLDKSKSHKKEISTIPYPLTMERENGAIAQTSLFKQRELEAESSVDFENYRKLYIRQALTQDSDTNKRNIGTK